MSWFGDGTLPQEVLEQMEYCRRTHNSSPLDMISALLQVADFYRERAQNELTEVTK